MRLIRGFGALAVLLLLLIGVPAALVALSGNPLPDEVSWESILRALLSPDDGTLVLALISVIGWIAWLTFAISTLVEAMDLMSSHQIRLRLPGLAGPQRLVAGLLLSVIAMGGASSTVQADPVRVGPAALPEESGDRRRVVESTARQTADQRDNGHVHVVKSGDDLWSLSEHFYGDGRQWRKIAMANPRLLSGGPDRLEPGWQLTIPDLASSDAESETRTVVVKRGDTLSSIAKEIYGSDSDWPRILHANRAQLSDPDDIVPGLRLVLPAKQANAKPAQEDRREPQDGDEGAQHEPTPPAETSTGPSPPQMEPPPVEPPPMQSPAEQASVALGLASVGSLLAAGVVAGLAFRRRVQLQMRPVGRKIASPREPAVAAEHLLGRRQSPLSLRTLDLATRAISAHCRQQQIPLPPLRLAKVGDDQIELVLAAGAAHPPAPFTVRGDSWVVDREHRPQLRAVPGIEDALRPYPSLVSIGRDDQDQQVLLDLEGIGLLTLDGDPGLSAAVLAAMAIELAFSPSADELAMTLIGDRSNLAGAVGKDNVNETDDLEGLLERWERRAAAQRAHQSSSVVGQRRIDPDLADPWIPEIALINCVPTVEQSARLIDLLTRPPQVTMAAVLAAPLAEARWSLHVHASGRDTPVRATLDPLGLELAAQVIKPAGQRTVIELISATGSEETTPAPWWRHQRHPPDPPPDNVTYVGNGLGKGFGAWINAGTDGDEPMETRIAEADVGSRHTMLQLLGPIELVDAAGTIPPRAGKQCLEYCAWLLENPRTTAQAMASALAVAEGTRRSNMSRLRNWLGSDPSGEPYLPDAYSGRIVLHPAVSSDRDRFQILTSPGINHSATAALRAALELVRGAPLADAAPGQWHWAEELRTDMISCVRDIGLELTDRVLLAGDVELARWAAARALLAAPGDELLMVARIRTEHQAGNMAETERLTLQVAAHARHLDVDLDPETVMLLQEVMEGQVRARMA